MQKNMGPSLSEPSTLSEEPKRGDHASFFPSQPHMKLIYHSNIEVVAALRELIVDVAKLLIKDGEGIEQIPREREGDIRRQAQDIVDFEILLANITINDTDRLVKF